MRLESRVVFSLSAALLAACTTDEADGVDEPFATDGKADSALSERHQAAVLRAANQVSLDVLDDEIGLSKTAARNIVDWRNGADLLPNTDDDRRFFSLDEVDDIPYVGPVSFDNLLAYALENDPDPTGAGEVALRVEEVNFGSGTLNSAHAEATPSVTFGAVIERGVLTLSASDDSPDVGIDVTVLSSPRVRVPISLDVSAAEMAVGLTVEGHHYNWQRGGQVTIAGCPRLGGSVRATLYGVRLLENVVGYSIKQVYGTVDVAVVADDGTLFCR